MVEEKTGFKIKPDTHAQGILRFVVENWLEIDGFCEGDEKWVESAALIVLEITNWGNGRLRASFVLGPCDDQDVRTAIYDKVLENEKIKIGRRTRTPNEKWKHLSSTDIQQQHVYVQAEDKDTPAQELAEKAILKFADFLKRDLGEYDAIVRETFIAN